MACPNMLSCAVLEWVKGFRRLGFQKRSANGTYTASNTASVRPPNHGLDGRYTVLQEALIRALLNTYLGSVFRA